MRTISTKALWLLCACLLSAPAAAGIDSRGNIDRSVDLIEAGAFALARSYLAPALIDPRLHFTERSRAYYLRGFSFYAEGLYVSASLDYARALEFNADNPMALLSLGGLYLRGQGVPRNVDLAMPLLERSAELGNARAMHFLGYAYLHGRDIEQDVTAARAWLTLGAQAGDASSMQQLAASYRAPFADPPDPESAKTWYEKAYSAGDARALVVLGYMHSKGEFGAEDPVQAAEYFRLAAEEGVGVAMLALGHAYLVGNGVEVNPEQSLAWFKQAAAAGEPDSYAWIGHLHQSGTGVPASDVEARRWFARGAEAGSREAQLRLLYLLLSDADNDALVEAAALLGELAAGGEPQWQNDFAWLLATSREASVRDGALALKHAREAVAAERSAAYLDTLAAAHAELGDFESAIDVQNEALAMLKEADARIRDELTARLDAYRAAQPWRE